MALTETQHAKLDRSPSKKLARKTYDPSLSSLSVPQIPEGYNQREPQNRSAQNHSPRKPDQNQTASHEARPHHSTAQRA